MRISSKINWKIKYSSIICFILTFYFFKPPYWETFKTINYVYSLGKWMLPIIILFIYFIKKRRPSKWIWLFIALNGWFLLNTIFSHGDISKALWQMVSTVAFAFIIDCYSDDIVSLFRVLMLHFELCIYINLFTVICFENYLYSRVNEAYGMTQEWFLSSPNMFIIWLFPALVIALIYKELSQNKKRSYLLIFAVLLTEIINGSGTGKVGVFVLTFLAVAPYLRKVITPMRSLIAISILVLMVVWFQSFEFLRPIIEDILHKDMTFTSRLTIWNNAINAIKENLLIGYGIMNTNDIIGILGQFPGFIWAGATHCHCEYLQIFFQGGIIGFFMYIVLIIKSMRKCVIYWKYRIAQLCTFAIVVYLIISMTEVFEYTLMYVPLMITLSLDKLVNNSQLN